MATTSIEWTDRVWNPVTGCTKVSAGCKNCYAETIADRFWATQYPDGVPTGRHDAGGNAPEMRPRRFTDVWTHDDRLRDPLSWRKPARVFVNSMSDLFHEDVPDEFIDRVFAVMHLAERHVFQALTKRPERMLAYVSSRPRDAAKPDQVVIATELGEGHYSVPWPLPNVWLGVSVEDQPRADERIPLLLQTPAAVRFISAEPLLGPVDLSPWLLVETIGGVELERWLDWVIVGGESGPGARPCNLEWIRSIVEQCHSANVKCFVKQLGVDPRGSCGWEHHDECPPQMLDEHGTLTSVTGKPGTLCHAVGDAWWPCRLKLKDRKGGAPEEWPEYFRRREFPCAK